MLKKVGLALTSLVFLSGCASAGAQVIVEPPPTVESYSPQEKITVPETDDMALGYSDDNKNLVTAEKAPTPKPSPTPEPEPTPSEEPAEEVEDSPAPSAEDDSNSQDQADKGKSESKEENNDSTVPIPASEAKKYAYDRVMAMWGSSSQYTCIEKLWERESNWNHTAQNPSSSAYGIPQSLPGNKMATHGADWRTNPKTQIDWGLDYVKERYGNPCGAWGHSERRGWY